MSIIIPALNEVAAIAATLAPLQGWRERGVEVILADGGSLDGTLEAARAGVDRVVSSVPGRSVQMNAGAAVARGDYLLFLHADTTLPAAFAGDIDHWATRQVAWGFFPVRLSGAGVVLRVVERAMNWRSRWTAVATGDQCLFVRRDLFRQLGGFPAIPLMEDVAMSKQLRRLSAPHIEAQPVVTSSRRWERRGVAKTVALMWWLRLAYFFGRDPGRLAKIYYPDTTPDEP
ncbi:TIGR04283 family arsenosugar biosynthesis glycosyltransferase [Exilibacterium tricleocarpae]|uniref:TIGR04283 family arsenosugar biosynthesis glycosyltransferase n=1 Tax=Exilibacterium tricleocarpae TaxID=2591008 RepID=UPI001FE664CF|nr:TIGR04283 family arsenosugar biosynthesis glycosyltransferase [Exilibacterium tricleocarpae]